MIRFETTLGSFTVELFEKESAVSAQNFQDYADAGALRRQRFPPRDPRVRGCRRRADRRLKQKPTRTPIRNEADNGLIPPRHALYGAHQRTPQRHLAVLHQPRDQRLLDPGRGGAATRSSATSPRHGRRWTRWRPRRPAYKGGHQTCRHANEVRKRPIGSRPPGSDRRLARRAALLAQRRNPVAKRRAGTLGTARHAPRCSRSLPGASSR